MLIVGRRIIANLFVTQNARLALEKKGVILFVHTLRPVSYDVLTDPTIDMNRFRDSSANKGGVTSSSLEVLVGMSLSDRDFLDLMTSPGDQGMFLQ